MNRFFGLDRPWRAGIVLTCIVALVALGCAPMPPPLRTSAPLQLLVFYSPL